MQKSIYEISTVNNVNKKPNIKVVVFELALTLMCFFIGRAVLLESFSPFIVSYFSVVCSKRNKSKFMYLFASGFGIMSKGLSYETLKYIGAIIIVFIIFKLFSSFLINKGRFQIGLVSLVSMMTANLAYLFIDGMLLYNIILGLIECAISFVMVYVFAYTVDVITKGGYRKILTSEEIICISITVALAIVGVWDLYVLGISIKQIMIITIIITVAYAGGAGIGCSMGITLSLVLSLASEPNPEMVVNYAFCGMVAGLFRELGRIGSGISFLIANSIITYYINKSSIAIIPLWEIVISLLVTIIMPNRFFQFIKSYYDASYLRDAGRNGYINRMRHLTVKKLSEFSELIADLGSLFKRITTKKYFTGQEELSKLFDVIAQKICSDCPFYRNCWDKNFYGTYQSMFSILSAAESKGRVEYMDVPDQMKKKCIRLESLIDFMNQVYDSYNSNMKWQKKIDECRDLVGEQLKGLSKVIERLSDELDIDIGFKTSLEESLLVELDKEGISVKDVMVVERANGRYYINIIETSPVVGIKRTKTIERVASNLLHKPMAVVDKSGCHTKDGHIIELEEKKQFDVLTGVARKAKDSEGICGDSYSFTTVAEGKYLMALSDGMGSGRKAAEESGAVITLLENFLETGFDLDVTIQTINSILLFRSTDEIFATADICLIDSISGVADFIKIGAVASFIKRDKKVEIIKSSSLPIGIIDEVEAETAQIKINEDDIIVLVTDGITDYLEINGDKDEWIANLIGCTNSTNPQFIAENILEEIIDNIEDGVIKDDMSVIAGRIYKPL